jgi:signal transduction histidine kinase
VRRLRTLLGSLPLRARLVAGFVAAMLIVLSATGGFLYWRVEYGLDRQLDATLTQASATIKPLITADRTVRSTTQADATGVGWQVLTDDGTVVASGGLLAGRTPVPVRDLRRDGSQFLDEGTMVPISASPLRLMVTALSPDGSGFLVVAVHRDHRDESLRELLVQLLIAGFGALLVTSIVGDLLARAALRPVERYRVRAQEISAGAPSLRLEVPDDRDDEVTRLGRTLNEMLTSLEGALRRERRFVDEASHELRTPLTLLRGRLQLARRRTRTVAEHEAILDELAVDTDRLVTLADQLLDLGAPVVSGTTDAVGVAASVVARHEAAGHRSVAVRVPDHPVEVRCAADVLDRILTNLLVNATRHGAEPIGLRISALSEWTVIAVSDAGAGMSAELLARATERFARADDARGRPGAGLGLALVEQLVREARGELRLCFGGQHVTHGAATGLPCTHDERMTVSLILPTA